MEKPQPTREHEWLARLAGEWTFRMEAEMQQGETEVVEGTESVSRFGDLWVIATGEQVMPDGATAGSSMTIGFDPEKGRFVGTFISTMMASLWIYDGELDESGTTLSLYSEGPTFDGSGATTRYKDVIELRGDERTMTSWALVGEEWQRFMEMRYSRARA